MIDEIAHTHTLVTIFKLFFLPSIRLSMGGNKEEYKPSFVDVDVPMAQGSYHDGERKIWDHVGHTTFPTHDI